MPTPDTDGRTLEGVSVSAALLGAVHDYAKGSSEAAIRMEGKIDTMANSLVELRTSSTTLAEIAKARREEELQDRQARIAREEREAEESAQAKQRVANWFSENWKYLGLVALLIFYPQVVGQMQALGILPAFHSPSQGVTPAPTPAPPERAAPVDESATSEDGE